METKEIRFVDLYGNLGRLSEEVFSEFKTFCFNNKWFFQANDHDLPSDHDKDNYIGFMQGESYLKLYRIIKSKDGKDFVLYRTVKLKHQPSYSEEQILGLDMVQYNDGKLRFKDDFAFGDNIWTVYSKGLRII